MKNFTPSKRQFNTTSKNYVFFFKFDLPMSVSISELLTSSPGRNPGAGVLTSPMVCTWVVVGDRYGGEYRRRPTPPSPKLARTVARIPWRHHRPGLILVEVQCRASGLRAPVKLCPVVPEKRTCTSAATPTNWITATVSHFSIYLKDLIVVLHKCWHGLSKMRKPFL